MTHEPVPLAAIFREVLAELALTPEAVIFGAHAVNAYCEPERMTADVDVLSTGASELAERLRGALAAKFHIATRVREVAGGNFRIYQIRAPKNRHLVDVRQVERLPPFRSIEGVQVVEPAELMAMKLVVAAGWDGREVSDRLEALRPPLPDEPSWIVELRESAQRVASLMQGPPLPDARGALSVAGWIAPDYPAGLPPPMVIKPF